MQAADPQLHLADNQLHPEQAAQQLGSEGQLPPLTHQDTPQEPHEQQHQDQAQQALPQTRQDLPPGHNDAQGQHHLP